MTIPEFVQPSISKFDGHYDFLAMTMENFLRSKELWSLVEVGIPTPVIGLGSSGKAQKVVVEAAKFNDLRVKNFLFQSIDREIFETILDKSTSQEIWNSIKQKYRVSIRVKRAQLQALRKEFELLTMKEGEKVDNFLGRTMTIVSKMKSNGEAVEQSVVLHRSLLVHEQRMIEVQEEEHMLKATHEHTSSRSTQEEKPGRGRGRGGFIGSRGRGRERQLFNKATIECFKCHRLGHFQYKYPYWDLESISTLQIFGGPIHPASHNNKRYSLSFIDDFTRKTWVYFLHEKS
ncbi:uncharacterized protein LOC108321170 isoform X1 [Vigna angularis]|uniref:uncharacterized protein LOC108321170 isoform X1 n=1 Tax=Phaseolus angularis TaxID=3914 RepID=UPI0022B33A30|nr:uncharacterized protein LOC108321170 isoform X1 [Vigna angularis]